MVGVRLVQQAVECAGGGGRAGRRVGETGVSLVGLRSFLERALARVLDAQARDYRHDLSRDSVLLGLDDHPGEPRVDGKLGELFADGGDLRAGLATAGLATVAIAAAFTAGGDYFRPSLLRWKRLRQQIEHRL